MNKKQIEMLFDMYEKLESDNEIIKKTLDILNPDNYNSFGYGFDVFNSILEIIKIEDEMLYEELQYLIFEAGLGKNKLSGNKLENGKLVKIEPSEYYITIDGKQFILTNKQDCINYLIENNCIKKD